MADRPIPVRLEEDIIERLDRIAEALTARAVGARVSRASAMRVALERGVSSIETELGLSRAKPKRKH
jgi:hypothetical protein